MLGGNWLARVGIVALILGVAFFISLAIDRGWLGETERVILGVLCGLVLLAAGEYYRTRHGVWPQAVGGGGLVFVVSSIWLFALDTPEALSEDLSLFIKVPMLAYTAAVVLSALAACCTGAGQS